MNKNILVLIPAHNEEKIIANTLMSLKNQINIENCLIDVFVICDNCTDNTFSIAKSLNVNVIETVNNKAKKSGALNFAYEEIGILKYDYILTIDADTIVNSDLIFQGLKEFEINPKLGAVCSRAGLFKQKPKNLMNKLLYHLQKTEYAEFDISRIERYKFIKVVHGMCAIYKKEAIDKVRRKRQVTGKACQIYIENNITEDYELTITIRECGYDVEIGWNMLAWTDTPLTIHELWNQRIRWLLGGVDTLYHHGWNKTTRRDILNSGFFWINGSLQISLILFALRDIIFDNIFYLNKFVLFVLFIMYIDCLIKLRFVQNIEMGDIIVRILFIPQIIYSWFNIAQQYYAYYLFAFNKNRNW